MKNVRISITLHARAVAALDGLIATGLFNVSRSRLAAELVREGLRRHADFIPRVETKVLRSRR